MKKILITEKQANQFNSMLRELNKIAKDFQTPTQLRRSSEKLYGLDFEEAIEMSYENIQEIAKNASKGIKKINIETPVLDSIVPDDSIEPPKPARRPESIINEANFFIE